MAAPTGSAPAPRRVVRRILLPTDLSEWAEGAVDYAVDLAAQLGAELRLFAVIDSPVIVTLMATHAARGAEEGAGGEEAPGGAQRRGEEAFQAKLMEDARRILQRDVDRAAARGVRAIGHAKVSEEAEEEILEEARLHAVDLILAMAPERTGLAELLIRSTAEEIMRRAPCPVLILRSRPRDGGPAGSGR